jgi:hypothetical protein
VKLFSILKILTVAVIWASLVSTSIMAVIAPLFDVHSLSNILGSWILYFFFIFAFEILVGVPTAILLYKLGMISWKIWIPVALAAGFLISFFFMNSNIRDNLYGYVLVMCLAVLSALIFRAVWEILGIRRGIL